MIAGSHSSADLCTDSDVNDVHSAQGFQRLKSFISIPLALHFEVGDKKSPAKPLQYLIVLKENAANCRRRVRASCPDVGIAESGRRAEKS
jgi:hypothetical protein